MIGTISNQCVINIDLGITISIQTPKMLIEYTETTITQITCFHPQFHYKREHI